MTKIFKCRQDVVEFFNENHAQILIGSEFFIFEEYVDGDNIQKKHRILKKSAFMDAYAEKKLEDSRATVIWLEHEKRRRYKGLIFKPSISGDYMDKYNLWRGFYVEPKEDASCSLFLEHVRENICRGDEGQYQWLMSWIADVFQQPEAPKGTVVILRGTQGVGKSLAMNVIGYLLGVHYKKYQSGGEAFRKFNADMRDALLIGIDEGCFVSNHRLVNKVKAQVTSDTIQVEAKGVDRIELEHYARYIITSNHEAVIRDDVDSRRFAMFTLSDRRKGDTQFFDAMMDQLQNGGYEKLLHILLNWRKADDVNLRIIPVTEGLLMQKIESLAPMDKWMYQLLQEGSSYFETPTDTDTLYEDFSVFFDRLKYRSIKPTKESMGRYLSKVFPEIEKKRIMHKNRYVFPPLGRLRNCFDIYCTVEWQWEDITECVEAITFDGGDS